MAIATEHKHSPLLIMERDPTRTLTLRNQFSRELAARFRRLRGIIRRAIIEEDVFALKQGSGGFAVMADMMTPGRHAFDFPRSGDKVNAFMAWLRRQEQIGILETTMVEQLGIGAEAPWTNIYVQSSYQRGIQRARQEMIAKGYPVPALEATGGIQAAFNNPFHVDRVGLLYTRTFAGLEGITAQMDTQISQVLAQAMAEGRGPNEIARLLTRTISGPVGDLGITDTLGRFIPAERRARILARTEIIRAHHSAMIQEYRNFEVVGVKVKAEWSTALDARVCFLCAPLEGRIFTLDQIQGMIPRHAQCFLDRQTPIYTSKGWKAIGKVEVGDLVLTHKKRFRKVYALPRTPKQRPKAVKFRFQGGMSLSMTANHSILGSKLGGSISRWKEADQYSVGDFVMLLANEKKCPRCGVLVPYFRKYCSRTCLSLDITDRQWADPEHRRNMSIKASNQLEREYSSGVRDKNTIALAANEKVRSMVKEGTFGWWMDDEFFAKVYPLAHTAEHRKASSERMKKNNPMNMPGVVEKVQHTLGNLYKIHPEKRINARMAKHRKSGKMTWIEQRMSLLLDKMGIDYVFQYPILRYNTDFAIPGLRIVIECDGEHWHQDEEKDRLRQQRIEKEGWFVLRYTGKQINQCLDEIENELTRVVNNHTGEYTLVAWPITSVEKWTVRKSRTLYNLSVEEDESYMAKGVVVHNCRCISIPVDFTGEEV